MEVSPHASKCWPSYAQQHEKEIEITEDKVDQLATKVYKANNALAASQEDVQYPEDRVAEQFKQLLP